jgi:hypothetical protein
MMINQAAIVLGVLLVLLVAPSLANAQTTINPIPTGLHKCIDLAVNVYGISVGLDVTTGKYDIKKGTDDAVKNIEGCVKGAYLKLYPNG